MLGSLILYTGAVVCVIGLALTVRPMPRIGIPNRLGALVLVGAGVVLVVVALLLPAPESRVVRAQSRLDEFVPRWQFAEFHTIHVNAPATQVYDAMRHVKADEIFLFKTLTWIRRGGRRQSESILNAGDREPLIDVALHNGFVSLAEEPPRDGETDSLPATDPGHHHNPLLQHPFDHPLPFTGCAHIGR